jgi:hypothetical protein
MQLEILVSAVIRVISLTYFIGAISFVGNLPPYLAIFSHASRYPLSGQTGFAGFISVLAQIALNILAGLVLWCFSSPIARFILRRVTNKNDPDAQP